MRMTPFLRFLNPRLSRAEARVAQLERELHSVRQKLAAMETPLTDQEFEHLDNQGLFVVGNARTGTSILCDCLNTSSDVALLGEAHLYNNRFQEDFAAWFNKQHDLFGNPKAKGTFLAPARHPEHDGLAALARLSHHFRYVGEKIALGPHGLIDGSSHQDRVFQFQATYFFHSRYLLTLRRPTETIWSMLKLFPDKPVIDLIHCWLDTLVLVLDILHAFPQSWVMFLEDLSSKRLDVFADVLGVQLQTTHLIRTSHQNSHLDSSDLPSELEAHKEQLAEMESLYVDVRSAFDLETLRLRSDTTEFANAALGFSRRIYQRVQYVRGC